MVYKKSVISGKFLLVPGVDFNIAVGLGKVYYGVNVYLTAV